MKFSSMFVTMTVLAVLLAGVAAATGVLIVSSTKEAGYNDAAYYANQEGKNGAAERLYLLALDENPAYETARYNLATLYFQQGKFDEAIAQLEILVRQDPSNPGYHYDLAVNLIENIRQNGKGLEQFDRAIGEYQTAESLSPGFAYAAENLAALAKIKAEFGI